MGKSVTIQLHPNNLNSFYNKNPFGFKENDLINISGYKRMKMLIKDIDNNNHSTTLTVRKGYMAAPKSKLRRKTVFSKIQVPILNKLTNL